LRNKKDKKNNEKQHRTRLDLSVEVAYGISEDRLFDLRCKDVGQGSHTEIPAGGVF
jgi:hypothetical protein